MPKTALDVITFAYRRIGVAAEDAPLSADQKAIGQAILEGLYAEFPSEGLTTLSNVDATPDAAFLGVAEMLANELEGNRYGIPRDEAKWRSGFRRLRRVLISYDRTDQADLDEDNTVSTAESDAYDRAAFY